MCIRSTTKQFIEKANVKHDGKFDYSLVEYVNNSTKVKIICSKHGVFQQIPNSHLQGNGCKKCMYDTSRLTTEQFINRSKQIHGNKFNYSLAIYKGSKAKVKLICNTCNDSFSTKAGIHLEGYNCPLCKSVGGYSKTQWVNICNANKEKIPIVYIIRCFNNSENFIKIGRTSQLITRRFNCKASMPYSYEVIKEIKGSPDFIFDKENELQKLYKEFKYRPLIRFDGITECFNISILQDILKH